MPKVAQVKFLLMAEFERRGYRVSDEAPEKFDFKVSKFQKTALVVLKNWQRRVGASEVKKYVDLFKQQTGRVHELMIVATSGFTEEAKDYVKHYRNRLKITTCTYDSLVKEGVENEPMNLKSTARQHKAAPEQVEQIQLGVFTNKGGVGKTTLATHIAGTLVYKGFDVVLVDLDPEQHLSNLIGEDGLYHKNPLKTHGNTLNVFNRNDWQASQEANAHFAVYDCSPYFEGNPEAVLKQLHVCVIPVMLSPMCVGKNGESLIKTLEYLHKVNPAMHCLVVVNQFRTRKNDTSQQKVLARLRKVASLFHHRQISFLDPETDRVMIRYSENLFHWGMEVFEGEQAKLAFKFAAAGNHPHHDFTRLVDWILQLIKKKH